MSQSRESSRNDLAAAAELAESYQSMRQEIAKVVIGQADVVEQLLIGLFARGHVLLVGVPGLAKTLLVSTVARILSLSFRRIQFTPDMMPSDITGTDILQDDPETGRRQFAFIQGPLFANIILADEINRTPPKTQAALLEAMQERHVTASGRTYPLPEPFFVLATQNPIEQEGTYPLPEAQLDRFTLNLRVPYPTAAEELEILRQTTGESIGDSRSDAPGRADRDVPGPGAARAGGRVRLHLCPRSCPRQPARPGRGDRLRAEVRVVGRRPACRPVVDPLRQGPRLARRPRPRHRRRRAPRRSAGAPTPDHDDVSRGIRRDRSRPGDRPLARGDSRRPPNARPRGSSRL